MSEVRQIRSAKDLRVYRRAYELAMRVFDVSRAWPAAERHALTAQVRRSSRSVCANLREAWAKRRYEAHFVSKLTDCDGENGETGTWLDFARDCGYLDQSGHAELDRLSAEVGAMLGAILANPAPFLQRSKARTSTRCPLPLETRPLTSDL